jgi:hypothetical protein
MGRQRYVIPTEESLGACRIWWGNLREKDYLEGVDIDGSIKWILKKSFERSDLDLSGLEQGMMMVACKYGDEIPRYIKFEEFPD